MTEINHAAARAREIRVVLPGLMLAITLAMLDNMIVATAMPSILRELNVSPEHLSWVVTAYVLGTTVSTPLWGKIGDLYGRKSVFLTAIVIFLVGSAASGAAQSLVQLIGFRALQGLGAGGLIVGVLAIIGDLVPPRERGRYQGQMAAIMAVAMVAGPLVGGLITDHLSWRWAFYINLPVGGIALLILALRLRLPKRRTEHRIDWFGALLLSVGITALVLITTWGGHQYDWASPQIFGLLGLAAVALVGFGFVERRVAEPIVPLQLFANRNFALVAAIGFLLGFTMFGALNFLPIYQQTVQGASATNSGLLLLPIMLGAMTTSLIVGRAITHTGRYRVYPIVGGIVMTAGIGLLSRLDVDTSRWLSSLYMVVLGIGMGFLMQTTMLIAQNSVEQRNLGVASSSATFMRSIGGSFGVALFGAIFARRFEASLTELGPAGAAASSGSNFDPAVLDRLPPTIEQTILGGISDGIATVFLWSVPLAVLVALLAWFVREVPLRGHDDVPAIASEAPAEATAARVPAAP
ncbi:MAG TPA: MDR family MFS transporter [Pilimelia sp.]|nr:MDR family MFS transporter [Pilimelia sp.]